MLLLPGIALAIGGMVLVVTQRPDVSLSSFADNWRANAVPYFMALAAALIRGLYSSLSRKWAGQQGSGGVPAFMVVTGLVLGLGRLLVPEDTTWSPRAVAELAYMAVVNNMAYVLWDRAMRKGNIILVASCSYLAPFLATVVGVLYLRITPGISLWIGCLLIVAGSVLCRFSVRDPAPE